MAEPLTGILVLGLIAAGFLLARPLMEALESFFGE